MKIVHLGNVANIAYLTVKALRERGLKADIFVPMAGLPAVSYPEWEEGDFDPAQIQFATPDWTRVRMRNGWQRPSWVKTMPTSTWHQLPFSDEDQFISHMEACLNTRLSWHRHQVVNDSLGRRGLSEINFIMSSCLFDIYRHEKVVSDYDIVVAYGADPIDCLVDFPRKPYIAVDYGSPLRTMIFGDSGPFDPRLLRAGYEWADKVVLTNPDTQPIAEELGLRYVFIPHPVDESKFRPGKSSVRDEIERLLGKDVLILFCPARQDWHIKGSDVMIRGVAKLLRNHKAPIKLILTAWGNDLERSRDLVCRERINDKVFWQPMLTKPQLAEWCKAADVILDQFAIGTFGLATAEAMACGKPVILNFKPKVHHWCFPELPPLISAEDEDEVFREVSALVEDAVRRKQLGQQSRDWFMRYHSMDVVAREHLRLYNEILSHRTNR